MTTNADVVVDDDDDEEEMLAAFRGNTHIWTHTSPTIPYNTYACYATYRRPVIAKTIQYNTLQKRNHTQQERYKREESYAHCKEGR